MGPIELALFNPFKSLYVILEASKFGTLLEAAFVDPAYAWPPVEGVGKNAIELQASIDLLEGDDISVGTTESMRQRMRPPPRPVIVPSKKWWQCCKKDDAAIDQVREYEQKKMAAKEARKAYAHLKREKKKQKDIVSQIWIYFHQFDDSSYLTCIVTKYIDQIL